MLLELLELIEESLVRAVLNQEKGWDRGLGVVVHLPQLHGEEGRELRLDPKTEEGHWLALGRQRRVLAKGGLGE